MIHTLQGQQARALLPLFANPHHAIAVSCLEGRTACRVFADEADHPSAALVVLERFGIGFAAGQAQAAEALLGSLHGWHRWYEIIDPPPDWYPALAAWSKKSHATVRYAMEADAALPMETLRRLATPPEGCALRPYDEALLQDALAEPWSEDQMGVFLTVDDFMARGMSVALTRDGALLAGCVGFLRHKDGYEIQIDTHPDHRGKGYATCVGAAFLLEMAARGMKPYWDAANPASFRLAEKLGFRFQRAYPAWLLIEPNEPADDVAKRVIGP